ncbi:B3/B4 domain-containing protein [Streptomyces chumphonensis]|uniref:B3/B4 domain-containing protein n=1 Tax=Streptomyces chumphonensis TaxID=1214925 RepID=UPI003D748B1E
MHLTVTVDPGIHTRAPHYTLGLIAVPAIEVTGAEPAVDALLTGAEDALHARALGRADVAALPTVAAWRDTYREFGVNPNRYPCAAESLLRRVAKGDRLPRINSFVDLCNAVSLVARLPVASCDVGDIDGTLCVRPADGGEVYLPLDAPDAPEHPEPGEVVYADSRGRAHSRRWNWRQSDVTKTDRGRRRLVLTVEAVHEGGRAAVEEALRRLAHVVEGIGPGLAEQPLVLDGDTPTAELFTAQATTTPATR